MSDKKMLQFNTDELPVFFLQMYYLATDIETMINLMADSINESTKNSNFLNNIDKNELVNIIKTIELCKSDLSICKIRMLDQVKVKEVENLVTPQVSKTTKKKDVSVEEKINIVDKIHSPPSDKKKANNVEGNNQINNAVNYFIKKFEELEKKQANE